jgi:predicted nucleic acid-binding protein
VKLAVDANVILSAIVGGRARLAMVHPQVEELYTTAATLAEVHEYAGYLAKKRRLSSDLVLLALAALPVTVVDRAVYAARVPEAARRIGSRDPDDAELLALALHLNVPVWSNDKDFEAAGVEWHTTAQLLRKLR